MNIKLQNLLQRIAAKPVAFLRLLRVYWKRVTAVTINVAHILGAWTSVEAVMESRTSQGAVAWAISLNTFPYIAVPAYWVFGRSEFHGYVLARQATLAETRPIAERVGKSLTESSLRVDSSKPQIELLQNLVELPATRGNQVDLLINGEATFAALFEAIDNAKDYILVQFYIVRADDAGNELRKRLIAKARAGVRIHFLYDELGCLGIPHSYLSGLRDAGVRTRSFISTRNPTRFQLNFRNHRKIVVVDGRVGFIGGLNVADEYWEGVEKNAPWRDTHARVRGPVVQFLQVPFAEDWFWATGKLLTDLDWTPKASDGDMTALCLPTGPADPLDSCALFFLNAINSARSRVWIATPYFVPDTQIISALQLAALRGVDVRILIPERPDSKMIYYSAFSYLPEVEQAGIKVFRYQPVFMHQKVMLVDDDFASIGTANFDNRSFRLNFEVTLAVVDRGFASQVEKMLTDDLARSKPAYAKELTEASFPFRLAVRVCALFSPIQ